MIDTNNLVMTAPTTPTTVVKEKFDKIGLIDADFIKYLVCSDIDGYIKRNGHHPRIKFGESYLYKFVDEQLKKQFFDRFDCKGMIFFFSGASHETFRYLVGFTKEYKGNRGSSEPAYDGFYSDLARVISVVNQNHNTYIHHQYEADDLVSALQNEHTFIYSRDKDLKQVTGLHYNVSKNILETFTESDCNYELCMQLLQGDSTDNIPGIEGVGELTAKKLLEGVAVNNRLSKVIDSYVQKYGQIEGYDRFCETWMLVKMRINRGGYEAEKFQAAYYVRDLLIKNNIENETN